MTRLRRLCLLAGVLFAAGGVARAEHFVVRDVWFERAGDGYALRARLKIGERARLDAILQGGYRVPLRFEMNFIQRRDWWFDKTVGDIVWRGVLSYDALLNLYAVEVGGRRDVFSSLDKVVERVEYLRGQADDDARFVKIFARDDIFLRARFLLEAEALPEPIKIALLLDEEWDVSGVWRDFPLRAAP